MKNTFSYAIGANPNSKISVGFESGRAVVGKNIAPREITDTQGGSETPTGEGTGEGG
jgi:hypothetical protein